MFFSYADFIAATVKLILYPFASYVIFRFTHQLTTPLPSQLHVPGHATTEQSTVEVDPWCLNNGISLSETIFQ